MPPADLCGNCRQCLDACPTGAFVEPYVLDARRCISYLTIELRGGVPEEFREAIGNKVYGCDICQEVCPYNREAPVTTISDFEPRSWANAEVRTGRSPQGLKPNLAVASMSELKLRPPEGTNIRREESLLQPRLEWLAVMSEEEFREKFRGSAMKRAKWSGLVRNACIALGNSKATAGHSPPCTHLGTAAETFGIPGNQHRGICPMGAFAHPITAQPPGAAAFCLTWLSRRC